MAKICILTGAHICLNPRVIKEASALAAFGHNVTVLGPAFTEELSQQDTTICISASWNHEVVVDLRAKHSRPSDRFMLRLSHRLAGDAIKYAGWESSQAIGYGLTKLYDVASRKCADLYIGHQEVGLWVGCKLLKAGKQVGADIEDWYSRDLLPEARASRPTNLLQKCESYMLKHGAFSLTTSEALASALATTYACPKPTAVYNVFPWVDRKHLDHLYKDRLDCSRVSIHWVSQTIGPGRGLETFCQALKQVTVPVDVHLRGNFTPAIELWLRNQFPVYVGHSLYLHNLVPPDELLSRIAEHDIGLALEPNQPDNKNLTISNKILHYLLAGLAVVATDTNGQTEIANKAPNAVLLFANGNVEQLAARLSELVSSPCKLNSAKLAAINAAKNEFCWEKQVPVLLKLVDSSIKR